MWTQVNNSKLYTTISGSTILPASSTINVNNLVSGITVEVGEWIVLDAFSPLCEIRKITGLNPTMSGYFEVTVEPGFKNAHLGMSTSTNDPAKIFFQTSPIWDILLFGADELSTTVNSKAIQEAVYDCARSSTDGGIVYIPKGLYILDNINPQGCVDVSTNSTLVIRSIKFIGEGKGVSILKLNGGNYGNSDVHLFDCNNVENLEWHDMTMDGNRWDITTQPGTQLHLINAYKCSGMKAINVLFIESRRDGIKLNQCNGILIDSSRFVKCGRGGIVIQSGTNDCTISNNYLEQNKNSDIDMEPTGNISPVKIMIVHNIIKRANIDNNTSIAISIAGIPEPSITDEDEDYLISGNQIEGCITIDMCGNVTIENNVIKGRIVPGVSNPSTINAKGVLNKLQIKNNLIIHHPLTSNPAINIRSRMTFSGGKLAQDLSVTGNTIYNNNCRFENCYNVVFSGNKVYQQNTDESGLQFIISENPEDYGLVDWGNITATHNEFLKVGKGIVLNTTNEGYKYKAINIDHNLIEGPNLTGGIVNNSQNLTYWETLNLGVGNKFGLMTGEQISGFERYLSKQHPISSQWLNEGPPNGTIDAWQGTLLIDKSREADNKYIHNMLDGNTGWTLLSEMGRQVLFEDEFQIITVAPPVNLNTSDHSPEISVLGNNWTYPFPYGSWAVKLLGGKKIASAGSLSSGPNSRAIATVSVASDVEIKALFRTDQLLTTNWYGGLIFRYGTGGYGQYNIKLSSGTFSLELFAPGSSTNLLSSYPSVTIGDSDVFELKVLLKGSFFSVFYNDLLILSFTSNVNISSDKHGLITNTITQAHLSCQSFKILLR